MSQNPILHALSRKGADKQALAVKLVGNPDWLPGVIGGLHSDRAPIRFGCGAVLDKASELEPQLLEEYRDVFVSLLTGESRILRWDASRTVGNLARIGSVGWFEAIFDLYFSPITGDELIGAANVIGKAPTVAAALPDLADRIAGRLLLVEKAHYRTPECRNVALGHVVTALDQFYGLLTSKRRVLGFVRRQTRNPRASTSKRACAFLEKRNPFK